MAEIRGSLQWHSSDLEEKRRLHKSLFPEGIYYDSEKRRYLTRNINSHLELVACFSATYKDKKNRTSHTDDEKSCPVPESRLELPTFGL